MKFLAPELTVHSLADISGAALREKQIRLLLIDRDNTLALPKSDELGQGVASWVEQAKELGFTLCILSNNTHVEVIQKTASKLGIPYTSAAFKPFPFRVKKLCKKFSIPADETCLIGDQVFTDVLAAKLSGVHSILVDPLTSHEAAWSKGLRTCGSALAHPAKHHHG